MSDDRAGRIDIDQYWSNTSKLVGAVVVMWAVFSMVIPSLVYQLNEIRFLTFPLGFYMAAQGSLIGFVWLIFWFNKNQSKIDELAVGPQDESHLFEASEFLKKLNKVYGTYAGGFLCFVLLMAAFEAGGVDDKIIGYLFVAFTIAVYAGIGILSRTSRPQDYYVADHKVPAIYNGMATAADWMSGASFVGMAGKVYYGGYNYLSFVVGWTGGYVIVATLIAPFLRKFEAYTVPDFLAARYAGHVETPLGKINVGQVTRVLGILVLFCASFAYLTAQIYSTAIIMSRFLEVDFEYTCYIGLGGILMCSMLGGMKGVTWTQVAQYIVLIVAYCLPVFWMSIKETKAIIPQLDYGNVLEDVVAREEAMLTECYTYGDESRCLADAWPTKIPGPSDNALTMQAMVETPERLVDWWVLTVCLMLGTASLPHVLMRYFTTPSVKTARKSVGWSLLFIFFLYITAPTYATFAKDNIYKNVIGSPVNSLPEWVFLYGEVGLTAVCGKAPKTLDDAIAFCAEKGYAADDPLRLEDLWMDTDVIVISTPEANGLPYTISALTAAGGLAASLSTADGLLLAMANSLSHDIYYNMISKKQASEFRRVAVSRFFLIVIAIFCAWVASTKPGDILSMVAWAFSLAATGNFPALFLGVWWKRTNALGVIAGILTGFPISLFYIIGTKYWEMELWGGIANIAAAIYGLPVSFVVTVVVSLLTDPPPQEIMDFVEKLREPDVFKKKGDEATENATEAGAIRSIELGETEKDTHDVLL